MKQNLEISKTDLHNSKASFKDIPAILFTFCLVLTGWIFFRSETVSDAVFIIKKIILEWTSFNKDIIYPKRMLIITGLIFFEWIQRGKNHALQIDAYPAWFRWVVYYLIVGGIILFGVYNYTPFIYFQF